MAEALSMHIAVDTNCILPGQVGGIEAYTVGLIQRLTGPSSPADKLLVLTRPENHALFAGFADAAETAVVCQPRSASSWDSADASESLRQFQDAKRRLLAEHGVDVVHFPGNTINPIDLNLPIVLNLHDLQHRHFPQYFSADELARRDTWWTASARRADVLLAASRFVADDLTQMLGINPGKIIVTPDPVQDEFLTPPTDAEIAAVQKRFGLGEPFFLYPAATWPHKNHGRLLEAFANFGTNRVQLILTGGGQDSPALHRQLAALHLHGQVRLLGRVDTLTLRCLYRLATGLVMPSEHESVSIPVLEAMASDCPIACSNITALPDQVGDAGLLFDPQDVSAIGSAMQLLLDNADLRAGLARRGRARLAEFNAQATTAALASAYTQAISYFKQSKAA